MNPRKLTTVLTWKRLWVMIVAVMLGGGLAVAVSTPALAVNNFIVNWANPRGQHGSDPLACVHGHNYSYANDWVNSYVNNCDVRVWVYGQQTGLNQCISPNSSASEEFGVITRVFISENSAKC